MKTELVIYRDLLSAYKAINATGNEDSSPNQAVWRTVKRVIANAQKVLGLTATQELQERAMLKAGINSPKATTFDNFDWDNPANWTVGGSK